MNLKPVLPSLREKKRYIAFEVISKEKISFNAASKSIWQAIQEFSGVLGAAKAGIWLLSDKFNKEKQKGILKVSHKYVDLAKSSLALIKSVDGHDVIVRSIGVSGVLNKAAKYI